MGRASKAIAAPAPRSVEDLGRPGGDREALEQGADEEAQKRTRQRHTPSMRRSVASVVFACCLVSCASAPRGRVASAVDHGDIEGALEAYEEFRRSEGGDVDLLAAVAALILEREAEGDDEERRSAALSQLTLAGTAGEPVLIRLSEAPGVGRARLDALSALARRGHDPSRLSLRALADGRDPTVLAAATLGMDPGLDRALLLELAGAPDTQLRRAAVRALGPVAAEDDVREALVRLARVDSEASVRAAAVGALGRAGAAAVDALRERLSDPHSSVRLAAVGALVQADQNAAIAALGPLLDVAPSSAGIEAARLLLQLEGADQSASARAFLRRALEADDASLRTQAGVALAGLPVTTEAPLAAVRHALETERDPEVRLSFARVLHRRGRASATAVLVELLEGEGLIAVQAAVLLAGDGDERALEVLARAITSGEESIVRRTAVRSLARDAMRPDAVRASLRDNDAMVRIFAAGGILAAGAAS